MPTVYQDRAGISLYDAQWSSGEKAPIPDSVTQNVIRALQRFKRTCEDFGVKDGNVRILATEATRQAINSEEYRVAIKGATGWTVEMLPKEDEGRVGAMGVVSSFSSVKGLMMDLGGGSTQITWLIAENGQVRMSNTGSFSMPYGAAALSRRLAEANKLGGKVFEELREEISKNLKDAVEEIGIPQEVRDTANTREGMTLYLSGGGFRGWGFVLMSQHPVSPYPIPIINGFRTSVENFHNTGEVMTAAASQEDIFRVSERRASQVPAVALLVSCLAMALPAITTVRFAQGGVREGSLFMDLDTKTKAQHPLVTATIPHVTPSTPSLISLLEAAIPAPNGLSSVPPVITDYLLAALGQSLYIHNHLNKDLQAAAALRSTTTGSLCGVHGASHDERAALGIMLCERWGGRGALSPGDADYFQRLLQLLGPEAGWWCFYYGKIAAVIGEVYPAGLVKVGNGKFKVNAIWSNDASDEMTPGESKLAQKFKEKVSKAKRDDDGKELKVAMDFGNDADLLLSEGVLKALKQVEKIGKKKNWPSAEFGHKIGLRVVGARREQEFA